MAIILTVSPVALPKGRRGPNINLVSVESAVRAKVKGEKLSKFVF